MARKPSSPKSPPPPAAGDASAPAVPPAPAAAAVSDAAPDGDRPVMDLTVRELLRLFATGGR